MNRNKVYMINFRKYYLHFSFNSLSKYPSCYENHLVWSGKKKKTQTLIILVAPFLPCFLFSYRLYPYTRNSDCRHRVGGRSVHRSVTWRLRPRGPDIVVLSCQSKRTNTPPNPYFTRFTGSCRGPGRIPESRPSQNNNNLCLSLLPIFRRGPESRYWERRDILNITVPNTLVPRLNNKIFVLRISGLVWWNSKCSWHWSNNEKLFTSFLLECFFSYNFTTLR